MYNSKTKVCKPSSRNSKHKAHYKEPCDEDPNDWEFSEWTAQTGMSNFSLLLLLLIFALAFAKSLAILFLFFSLEE